MVYRRVFHRVYDIVGACRGAYRVTEASAGRKSEQVITERVFVVGPAWKHSAQAQIASKGRIAGSNPAKDAKPL